MLFGLSKVHGSFASLRMTFFGMGPSLPPTPASKCGLLGTPVAQDDNSRWIAMRQRSSFF